MKFIKDSKGEQSLTATAFIVGFIVFNIKLLLSGITIMEGVTFSEFSGADYGIALGALGSIYVMRRYINKPESKSNE